MPKSIDTNVKPVKEVSNPWQLITNEELAKHNDVDKQDAWMAIRGIVYDVSEYAAKHPGGVEKIVKYAGRDATEVFNMVHSYVDFQEILYGHQVGILKGHPNAPKRTLCAKMRDKELCCFGTRYKPPTTYFRQDSIVGTYIVMFRKAGRPEDWTVAVLEKQELIVFKYIDIHKAWMSHYFLPEPLLNDAVALDFKNDCQNIEITLRKPMPSTAWAGQTHGIKDNGKFVSIHQGYHKFEAWILTKKCLSHNILLFGIQLVPSAVVGVPIGFHVDLFIGDVSRPYTPVCQITDLVAPPKQRNHEHYDTPPCILYFVIKIYANGQFTKALDETELDDGSETCTIHVSTPHGYFPLEFLHDFSLLLLIAGGSGIAPMIKIIQYFTDLKDKMRGRRVALIFFAEKFYDLIWRKEFKEMEDNLLWFFYFPVLTQPSEQCNWQGPRGRINRDIVLHCLQNVHLDKMGVKKACICGPAGFNKASVESLEGIVLNQNIFVFD